MPASNSTIAFWACMILANMHQIAGNKGTTYLFFGVAMLNVLAQLIEYVRKGK